MKKILYTLIVLTVLNFTAKAQESSYSDSASEQTTIKLGLKGGFNFSDLNESGLKTRTDLHIGGVMEIFVNNNFSIQPELMYSSQGAREEEDTPFGRFEAKMKINYINVPVMFKYYVRNGFSIQAGPQIGFVVSSKLSTDIVPVDNIDLKSITNSVDFGFNMGLGYEFSQGLFFDARYNFGLTNTLQPIKGSDFDGGGKNRVFQLSVGYKF